jgi:hypothetical protein
MTDNISFDEVFWPSKEGPSLGFESVLMLSIAVGVVLFCVIYNLIKASQNEGASKGLFYVLALQWKPIVLVGFAATYLFLSGRIDFTDDAITLYAFSAVCWIILFLTYYALFDMLSAGLSLFGLSTKTKFKSVNLALSFLVGSRLSVLLLLLLVWLDLDTSINVIFAMAFIWLVSRACEFKAYEDTWKLHAAKVSKNWRSRTAANMVILICLLIPLSYCLYIVSFIELLSWDNFTHWLILPQEMLSNNKYLLGYDVSSSVAPSYPPQQVSDFTILLHLWGNTNLSEVILAFHNPLMMFLGAWIILDLIKRQVNLLGLFLIALCLSGIILALPIMYWGTAYGDARAALCLLLMAASFSFIKFGGHKNNLVIFLLVMTSAFTLKPNLVPFAVLAIPFLFFLRLERKKIIIFSLAFALIAILEVFAYKSLSPESLLISDAISLSRFFEWRFPGFWIGLNLSQYGLHALITSVIFGLAFAALSFFNRYDFDARHTLRLSALMMLGLAAILILVIWNNRSFGNSLDRYLLNLILVFVYCVLVVTLGFKKKFIRSIAGASGVISVFAALFFAFRQGSFFSASEWYRIRLAEFQPFRVQSVEKLGLVKDLKPLDMPGDARRSVIIYPYENLSDQPYFNYALTRATRNFYAPTRSEGKGPIDPLFYLENYELIESWLEEERVAFLHLSASINLLGIDIAPGFYTRNEFLARLNGR